MKNLFFLFLLTSLNIWSQSNKFVVVDSITNEVIESVNIYYPERNEGTITNSDGEAIIELKKDSLTFSHINYFHRKVSFDRMLDKDTVSLIPKNNVLDEVVVTNFNLKRELIKTMNQYEKFYPSKKMLNECTYKEAYRTNNKLARLIQAQIKWWYKDYRYNFKKSLNKQSEFNLINIDYSKVSTDNSPISTGGFIENSSLIPSFHLNYFISYVLHNCTESYIDKIVSTKTHDKVVFTSDVIENNKKVAILNKSEIVFDKQGAIIYLKFIIDYQDYTYEKFSERKQMAYVGKTERHVFELNFKKMIGQTYQLSSYKSHLTGNISYSDSKDSFDMRQELFVTKSDKDRSIKNSKILDLSKPFYENIPSDVSANNKILLSKKEQEFVH